MQGKYDPEAVSLQWRRTRIIATLGPASASPAMIARLLEAGVDMVRLNMSHGDHDSHRTLVNRIRRAAKRLGRHIPIMMDLCGPKIRVGLLADGSIDLAEGEEVTITTRRVEGGPGLIPSQYSSLHKDVSIGERILLDDGKLELKVLAVEEREVRCQVIQGGKLSNKKGINLPDSEVSAPALTDKDKKDADLGIELGVDFLALSFVRRGADVQRLNRYLQRKQADIPVISKIERPEAVDNIDDIIEQSYGIMVARGDLGIELPAERVPLIQRDLIHRAREKQIPVIVATQMLESMLDSARPTRAEVTDVANAALLGADAVMLSGETASGDYPFEAVTTMNRILREIERHQWRAGEFAPDTRLDPAGSERTEREAVANAAEELARDLKLAALIIPTSTGTTARVVAAHRVAAPTIGVCADERICRRMALHWGVVPVHTSESGTQDWRELSQSIAEQTDLAKVGHRVLIVSGFSDDPALNEPVLKLMNV